MSLLDKAVHIVNTVILKKKYVYAGKVAPHHCLPTEDPTEYVHIVYKYLLKFYIT